MAEPRTVAIAELEMMSLAERTALRDERTITDLAAVDPEFLDRVRREARHCLANRTSPSHLQD